MIPPANSSDADRKSQRITPECQPQFPCELMKSFELGQRGVLAYDESDLRLYSDYTHWRPVAIIPPPAHPYPVAPTDPVKMQNVINGIWPPAPSKETIAREASRDDAELAVMAGMAKALAEIEKQTKRVNEGRINAHSQVGTIALYECKIALDAYREWKRKPKLRALDRAGEAKGAERQRIAEAVVKYIEEQELDNVMNRHAVQGLKDDITFIITKETA